VFNNAVGWARAMACCRLLELARESRASEDVLLLLNAMQLLQEVGFGAGGTCVALAKPRQVFSCSWLRHPMPWTICLEWVPWT
jgi:hypothetical protein